MKQFWGPGMTRTACAVTAAAFLLASCTSSGPAGGGGRDASGAGISARGAIGRLADTDLRYTGNGDAGISGAVLARIETLSRSIGGGNEGGGMGIMNDLQMRDRWIEVFRETARIFDEHPPYEITFDPALEQEGEADHQMRTATLAMRITLSPSRAGFDALNALLEELAKTGRRRAWGFEGRSFHDLCPSVPGAKVMVGGNAHSFTVEALLLNGRGGQIGRGSVTLGARPSFISGASSSYFLVPPMQVDVIRFQNVKVDSLTPALTIVINSVNGIPSRTLNATGYMCIAPFDSGDPVAYNNRGKAYHYKGDFDRAIADYTEAIRLDPDDADLYSGRSDVYASKGDYDRAIAGYTEAIRLDPVSYRSGTYCERAYRNILGFKENYENDAVFAFFAHAIRLDPNDAEVYLYRGIAYRDKGDYDQAIADYTEAIRLRPGYASAYSNRGDVYRDKGDYDRAIADYTEAIRLDPDDADLYSGRSNLYVAKGDYDRAIADYAEAIRFDPVRSGTYSERGSHYLLSSSFVRERGYHYSLSSEENYDAAFAFFAHAIRLDPNDAEAYLYRGIAYSERGDYDRAIADYTEAIRLGSNYAWAYRDRGNAYLDKEDYDRAIADYTEAIRLDPDYSDTYLYRGDVYRKKGDYDRAIADYTEAIRLRPGYASAYSNRGDVYRKKGDHDRAIADYTQVIRLDYRNAATYNNRGNAYANKRDYDRAIADYTEAIRLNRYYTAAAKAVFYRNRGNAYYRKADYDRAIADYEEAVQLNPSYRADLEAARRARGSFRARSLIHRGMTDIRFRRTMFKSGLIKLNTSVHKTVFHKLPKRASRVTAGPKLEKNFRGNLRKNGQIMKHQPQN